MDIHVKNTIKVASVYTGTVIGAGFASGQEIVRFFIIYGENSFYGIIVSAILFSLIGAVVLNKIYCRKINGYDEYVIPLVGRRLGKLIEILICLFMLSSFCVMVAGSGAIFYEQIGIRQDAGIIVMALLCLIVFLYDIRGVVLVNTVMAPIMLVGMVILGCYILISRDHSVAALMYYTKKAVNNLLVSSLIYVSYNTLTIVVIMTSLLPILTKRWVAIMGGVLGGISLGIVALVLWAVMIIFYADIFSFEIPFLQIVIRHGKTIEITYVFILYCAMFTTAVASGYGFLNQIVQWLNINRNVCSLFFCILSIPMAKMGFSRLVSVLYPLFGYLGLLMIAIIIFDGFRDIFITNSINRKA